MPIIKDGDKLLERAGLGEEYRENLLKSQVVKKNSQEKPAVIPSGSVRTNPRTISPNSDNTKLEAESKIN